MSEMILPDEDFSRHGPSPLPLQLAAMMLRAGTDVARLREALEGIARWRAHPFRRPASNGEIIHRIGTSSLLDLGGGGPPVLLVPSLVNPATILDLLPGNSLAQGLKAGGLHVFVLDWGRPGDDEWTFCLADYIRRLSDFCAHIAQHEAEVPHLVGYCMGGTLATALALHEPHRIGRLALLAAPWDFHAGDRRPGLLARAALPLLPLIERLGFAPNDLVQSFFASLNPGEALVKFAAFATRDPGCAAAELFVALEDWLNGGADLPARVAIEVLRDWYGLNLPGRGSWSPFGAPLDPVCLAMPVFAAVPERDRIVPPESAIGLAAKPARLDLRRPSGGHVGMVVGRRAGAQLVTPLGKWLAADA